MRTIFFVACFSISLSAFSSNPPDTKGAVPFAYDPVFWKHSLHLSTRQLISIEQINSDFYSSVKTIASHATDQRRDLLNQFLLDRNNRIWNVFSRRQQTKWKRITIKLNRN
jgi:hypothetical protein